MPDIQTRPDTARLFALAEAAFLPLETHASLEENGNVQIRILDGAEAVHVEERPLDRVEDEQRLQSWLGEIRERLQRLGYDLDAWDSRGRGDGPGPA